ncbi:class I SAM-dependent methyltransferase [Phenylobacterium sp.]|uniref:class I SAM-dependent methyltransferase n=1 Tax=Phenylobacterium sp. TaxID=1871053 RepID=UPI002DF2B023|nr:methyltransferase domain-containing protein [Phenylobacterium sp.]
MELRATFDTVAEIYDAVRPGYPEPLFDDIAAMVGLGPGDPVLEVGCGSGQATESLYARRYAITALDPGPALIAAARRRFADAHDVAFVISRFEDWVAPAQGYRLVAAAQSWHWTPQARAFAGAALALRPDGWLAVFGSCPVRYPPWFLAAAKPLYMRHAPELWGPPSESWYLPQGPVSGLFAGSGWFAPATHRAYPWIWPHTAESYRAFLRSRSDFNGIAEPRREALIDALAEAIVAHGGELEIGYESHLYLAAAV